MTVPHDEFVSSVRTRSDLESDEQAARAAKLTLSTLAERLTLGAAEGLAAELPAGFRDPLRQTDADPESFPPDEFVDRVEARQREFPELTQAQSRRHVEAVLSTLRDQTPEAFETAVSQLPNEYERLYELPP